MRVLRWAPFAILVALALWYGLHLGERSRQGGETAAALDRVADRYVREVPGGRRGECVARPGQGAIRLVVTCGRRERLPVHVYRVDRQGRITAGGGGA
jgi:hypothetical protein